MTTIEGYEEVIVVNTFVTVEDVYKSLDGSVLQEGVGDFQTPECIERMGPRKAVKRGDLPRQYTLLKRLCVGIGCYRSFTKRRSLPMGGADTRAQTLNEAGLFGGGPEMATRHRVNQR